MVRDFLELIQIPVELTTETACTGQPWEYFDGGSIQNIQKAKAICLDCPVRELCLDWAITHEISGIWGGKTPRQRARMRGNQKFIDVELVSELIELRKFLYSDSAENLAQNLGTTPRSIYRRRASLKKLEEAI